jgi:hypothetical protein
MALTCQERSRHNYTSVSCLTLQSVIYAVSEASRILTVYINPTETLSSSAHDTAVSIQSLFYRNQSETITKETCSSEAVLVRLMKYLCRVLRAPVWCLESLSWPRKLVISQPFRFLFL